MDDRTIEEGLLNFRNLNPRIYWNLYQGCLERGFDDRQAFSILTAYILSTNPNGIQPNPGTGPKTDEP